MAISCRESLSSRCFHSGDRIKVTNNALSHRRILACYAQSALAISLPLPRGSADQQFSAAVAHGLSSLLTPARTNNPARRLVYFPANAFRDYGRDRPARRRALSLYL